MHRETDARRPAHAPRRTTPTAWRKVALGLLLATLLVACGTGNGGEDPPPPPPPPPTDGPSLLVSPSHMNGVTSATVQVAAEGSWTLELEASSAELQSAASLSRTSGEGSQSVTLSIEPGGLDRFGAHALRVRLRAGSTTREADVTFSFPDVNGRVRRASEFAGAAAPEGDIQPLMVEPAPAAGGAAPESVTAEAIAAVADADGTVTLLVGLEPADAALAAASLPGTPAPVALQALSATVSTLAGAAVESRFDAAGLAYVEVPAAEAAEAIARLRATAGVRYVDLPVPIYPHSNDEFRQVQWNLDAVRAEQVWSETRGEGVTIAILDNGFYPDHPDLRGNVVDTYDAGDERSDITVTNPACGSHGTHVAGIAAAVADNGIGIAGAAPGADLLLVDLDVRDAPGCPMNSEALVRGLEYVYADGSPRADIVNMSLGASSDLGQSTRDALIALDDAGIVLIGSAGNTQCVNGADTFVPVSYPAAYPEVWAVAATDPADERACYSHVGGEVLIAAPGGDTSFSGSRQDGIYSTVYDFDRGRPDYGYMEGTSMAAPLVAGIAALLKSGDPSATPDEIRDAITSTATDLGDPGRDYLYGYGLIDAPRAYEALVDSGDPLPPPPDPPTTPMCLVIPGYPPTRLDPDGIFTAVDAPLGPLTVRIEAAVDGGCQPSGELLGEETITVRFDQVNQVYIEVDAP